MDVEKQLEEQSDQWRPPINPSPPMGAKWMTFCRWEEEIPDPRGLEGFGIS